MSVRTGHPGMKLVSPGSKLLDEISVALQAHRGLSPASMLEKQIQFAGKSARSRPLNPKHKMWDPFWNSGKENQKEACFIRNFGETKGPLILRLPLQQPSRQWPSPGRMPGCCDRAAGTAPQGCAACGRSTSVTSSFASFETGPRKAG